MFVSGNRHRFNTPQLRKVGCGKLAVDGEVVSHPNVLLREWAKHFSKLVKREMLPGVQELWKVDLLDSVSMRNDEMLLDVPFSAE